MSVAAPPVGLPAPPTPRALPSSGPVLLTGIRWQTYESLLADIGDRPVRLTYDRGILEIMAPAFRHEVTAKWIGELAEVSAEEADLPYFGAGSTTFRREDLDRGLEPDECFYFANAARMLGCVSLDLTRDPPPDLAIEVDITSSSMNRMGIYAALRVPEVWRWHDGALTVHQLQPNGTYLVVQVSPTFPWLPIAGLVQFVEQVYTVDHLTLKKAFRAWVRQCLSQK